MVKALETQKDENSFQNSDFPYIIDEDPEPGSTVLRLRLSKPRKTKKSFQNSGFIILLTKIPSLARDKFNLTVLEIRKFFQKQWFHLLFNNFFVNYFVENKNVLIFASRILGKLQFLVNKLIHK